MSEGEERERERHAARAQQTEIETERQMLLQRRRVTATDKTSERKGAKEGERGLDNSPSFARTHTHNLCLALPL